MQPAEEICEKTHNQFVFYTYDSTGRDTQVVVKAENIDVAWKKFKKINSENIVDFVKTLDN
jgi:hypothetical protein